MIHYTKMCCHHYSSVQERVRKLLIDYHNKVSLSLALTHNSITNILLTSLFNLLQRSCCEMMMSPLNRHVIDYDRPTLIAGIFLSIYRVFQIFMQPMTEHQFNY